MSFKNFDFTILLLLFLISVLGLASVWSIAPEIFLEQLLFLIIGFVVFFLFSRIDLGIFESVSWFLYFAALFLLILTFLFGQFSRGATRWLQLGILTFQPSEIVKPLLVLFLAGFLAKSENLRLPRFLAGFLLFLIPVFLIFKQPDLGSSLVVFSSFLGIFLGSGASLRFIIGVFFLIALFIPATWQFLADYQKARISTFLNPQLDPLGAGYNQLQAMIAVGSGKFLGRGLGKGIQSHLAFLPEYQTDFIFASFVEEFGLIGGFTLLLFYFLLLYKILKIARQTSYFYGKLVALGVFSMLCFQIFINVGMNMGLTPITGITLPFISVGGSSIISLMICLGLVEAAACSRKSKEFLEIK